MHYVNVNRFKTSIVARKKWTSQNADRNLIFYDN